MGLKTRFTFFFSLFIILLLGSFATFVYFKVEERMLSNAEETLSEHLEHEALHLPEQATLRLSDHPPHRAALYVRILSSGKVIDSSFPTDFDSKKLKGISRELTTNRGGTEYRLEGFFDLSETESYLTALKRVLVTACVLCALAILPFGYFLTRFLLLPFRVLAKAAEGLTAKQLSYRFSSPETKDEFGSLIESFNKLLEKLEASFSQIERFATQASHELRTPIAVLKSQIEVTLRRKRTTEEYVTTLEKLKAQTERLDGLTEKLLTLSDIERTAHAPATNVLAPIRPLLQEIADAVITAHPELRKDFDLSKVPSDLKWRISPTYFNMLMTNLLDNAVKYAAKCVRVTATEESGHLVVQIEDDGPGVPDSNKEQIFEPFYRIPSDNPKGPKGHGLGLAVVKACAEACAGRLSVDKSSLGGARFSVAFPF